MENQDLATLRQQIKEEVRQEFLEELSKFKKDLIISIKKELMRDLQNNSPSNTNEQQLPSETSANKPKEETKIEKTSSPASFLESFERKEFHDPHQFPFTLELERNWEIIRSEFIALNEALFHPWPEQNLYKQNGVKGKGWDVFGLYAFGKKHYRNARLCPFTTSLVEQIPGLSTAAFSILTPFAKIVPHVGYYGYSEMVLRCHLGLVIPEQKEKCYLMVGPHKQSWEEGKTMVFDDTFLHSAVNDTNTTRVVLLLDFSAGELPKEYQRPNPDEDDNDNEEGTPDQREYLDIITKQYGYGIPEEELENNHNANQLSLFV